jgi:hypothetical protein
VAYLDDGGDGGSGESDMAMSVQNEEAKVGRDRTARNWRWGPEGRRRREEEEEEKQSNFEDGARPALEVESWECFSW